MTTALNTNLLRDPSAESATPSPDGYDGVVAIPGWATTSNMTVDFYGEPGGDLTTAEAPPKAGSNYFFGGPNNSVSSASQTIAFRGILPEINAGEITATISGYLGGYGPQSDHADIDVSFLNASGTTISTATVSGPTSFPQGTSLTFERATVTVPAGTVAVTYTLVATRDAGSDNDGLADKLSFILKQVTPSAQFQGAASLQGSAASFQSTGTAPPIPAAAASSMQHIALLDLRSAAATARSNHLAASTNPPIGFAQTALPAFAAGSDRSPGAADHLPIVGVGHENHVIAMT
jgi:hypothetical protein